MRRWLYRLTLVGPVLLTLCVTLWVLTLSPFTQPFVERTTDGLRVALERQMARAVTADWLVPRFREAVAEEDLIRLEMLVELMQRHDVAVPRDDLLAAQAMIEARSGFLAGLSACGACAYDITTCDTLTRMASCALPVEISPLGDINALRRGAVAYATGAEVDRFDVGLALVGIAATGAVLATGGGSATIKLGAGLLRTARRMGTLTGAFGRELAQLARLPVRWGRLDDYVMGRAGLDAVTDTAQLARFSGVVADLGRIRRNTSTPEALLLMGRIESAEDAARVARVSDAAGARTRATFEVLGKSRVFRALVRLSDLAISALALIYLTALQGLCIVASRIGGIIARLLRPALRAA